MPLVSITDKRPQHRKQKKKTHTVHVTTVIDVLVGIGIAIGNVCFHLDLP